MELIFQIVTINLQREGAYDLEIPKLPSLRKICRVNHY